MWIQFLGQEDPLEEVMAAHCSILAWRIAWTEEPGRLWSVVLQRVGHDWSDLHAQTHWFHRSYCREGLRPWWPGCGQGLRLRVGGPMCPLVGPTALHNVPAGSEDSRTAHRDKNWSHSALWWSNLWVPGWEKWLKKGLNCLPPRLEWWEDQASGTQEVRTGTYLVSREIRGSTLKKISLKLPPRSPPWPLDWVRKLLWAPPARVSPDPSAWASPPIG